MKTDVNYAELECKVFTLISDMCNGNYANIDSVGTVGVTVGNVRYIVNYCIGVNGDIKIKDYKPIN